MKRKQRCPSVVLICLLWLCVGVFSTPPAGAATPPPGNDLGTALKYYHDGDYDRAYPLFKELSERTDSLDLLFWTGVSAGRSGQCKPAVEKLERVLASRPDMTRTRLELGIAHYNCRDYGAARTAFESVLAADPPPEIQNVASRYLKELEKEKRKSSWFLQFSQAYQYDDNINSGPDDRDIDDTLFRIILDPDSEQQESGNWVSDLRAGFLNDLGKPDGFLLNGDVLFHYVYSFEDTDFNYMNGIARIGPWWKGKRDLVKAPLGYEHKRYGGDALSNSFLFEPDWEHYFTDRFSLEGGYALSLERYDSDRYTDRGYDNVDHRLSIGPNIYLRDRRYTISGRFTHQIHDADEDIQSYDAEHLSLSFLALFPTDTELLLFYRWTDRTWDAPSTLYGTEREDTRHTFVGMIAQHFLDHFFAAAEVAYITNDGNGDLFDFDKTTFTLRAGVRF